MTAEFWIGVAVASTVESSVLVVATAVAQVRRRRERRRRLEDEVRAVADRQTAVYVEAFDGGDRAWLVPVAARTAANLDAFDEVIGRSANPATGSS